jgi:uncharacterized membrane protein
VTALTFFVLALTTVAFWSAPVLARPTVPFGVRVPTARAAEPAIVHAYGRYARGVVLLGVVVFATLIVASLGFDWAPRPEPPLVVLVVGCCALGYQAHRSVAAAKRDGDWYAGTRQAVTADTSLRADPVRPQWILLVPAVALLVLTAGIGAWRYADLPVTLPTPNGVIVDAARRTVTTAGYAFATVTAQLLIILLVGLLALAIPRARPELDAEQPAGSATRYRAYLRGVLRLLFVSASGANASLLVASLQVWEILQPTLLVTVVSYLPLAAALVAWAVFAVRTGDAGHRLPAAGDAADGEESRYVQRDDDRYWHAAGMVYLNRRDPAVLVHRRVGMYWTLNLGHPVSWAILALIALVAVLTGFGVIDLPTRGG